MAGDLEDATDAKLPFGLGEVDLTDPMALIATVFALIAGATIWNMADGIGQNAASYVNSILGNIIGQNPATGETADNGGAFD